MNRHHRAGALAGLTVAALLALSSRPAPAEKIEEFRLDKRVQIKADWNSLFLRWSDLNGDGRLDFLTVNIRNNVIETYLQTDNEDQPFELKKWFIERDANDVAVADFNRDGRPDVILAGKPCQIFCQDAEHAFENAIDLDFDAQFLLRTELNGDEEEDLLSINRDKLILAIRDPQAKIGGAPKFEIVEQPSGHAPGSRPFLADLNGDGRDDLAYVSAGNKDLLVVRYRNEDRHFNPERTYKIGFTNAVAGLAFEKHPPLLAVLDDKTETAKVLTLKPAPEEERSEFPFDDMQVIPFQSGVFSDKEEYVITDLDGDGRDEIYHFGSGEAEFKRFRIDKKGAARFDKFPCLSGISKARVAKLGKAKRPTLVFVTPKEEALGLITAEKGGGLSVPQPFDPGIKPLVFDVCDMNDDGLADLVVGVKGADPFRFYRGTRAGEFVADAPVALKFAKDALSVESDPLDIVAADLDHDGTADLVVFYEFGSPQIFTQDAKTKEFQAVLRGSGLKLGLFNQIRPKHFRLMDGDGDGKDDIVLLRKNYARVLSLDKEGGIELVAQFNGKDARSDLTGAIIGNVTSGKDRKGNDDLALLDQGNNLLTIYRRNDPSAIVRSQQLDKSECYDLHSGDLNGDGWPDLLVEARGKLGLMLRNVAPVRVDALSRHSTDVEDGKYGQLRCIDFNQDGADEILLFERTKHLLEFYQFQPPGQWERFYKFIVFQGDGPGRYAINAGLSQPRQIEALDYNNDGKIDLVLLIHDNIILYPGK